MLAACRFYHALLPNLFERLDDETELLLPDDLLTEHSVVHGFRTEISDEDCAEVELLGWLYQFYISEKKDQVMARKSRRADGGHSRGHPALHAALDRPLPRRKLPRPALAAQSSQLAAARAHALLHRRRGGDRLPQNHQARGNPPARSRPSAAGTCSPMPSICSTLIYEEEGYAPAEIPALILTHNLHGLEICPRAAQLADWPSSSRPGRKSRRFFQPEHLVRPHIIELQDVRFEEGELRDYISALGLGDLVQSADDSSCSTSSRRRRTSARSSSRASTKRTSPSPAAPSRRRTSAASSSCARRTSKSCACSNKPRRSPSGITSSWPIRRIWAAAE